MLGNPPGFGFRLVADSQTHLAKKDLMGRGGGGGWGRQTILVCGIMSFAGITELLLLTGLFSGTHFRSVSNRWAKLIDFSGKTKRHKFWMWL